MSSILQEAAALAPTEFESIPVIDLSLPEDELVRQVRQAALVQGFFYIKNHTVPEDLVQRVFGRAETFFNGLSEEEKMTIHMSKSSAYKGYMGLLSENVDPENRGDLHEALDLGTETPGAAPAEPDANGLRAGNLWPDEKLLGGEKLTGFREDVMEYYQAVYSLGRNVLFPLFALALDLPRDYFYNRVANASSAAMRLLYYPPQTGVVDDRVMGIGAHSDYECFTILRQQMGVKALQVCNRKGQWIDAEPMEGTFVVNIADALQHDVFVSTRHRAINRTGLQRFSIPFFFGEDADQIITTFPSCVSAERPQRYEDISAGEYIKGRLDETYTVSAAPEGNAASA